MKAWFEAPYLFMATDPSGSDVGTLNPSGFSTAEVLRDVDRPLVVAGHLPDPSRPFDVAVNEFAADKRHLHLGSRFRLYAYSYPQIAGAALITQGALKGPPRGPSFTVKVTGIVRFPDDVSAVLPLAAKQDVTYEGQQNMYMTPAFLGRLAAGLGIPVQELPDINFYGVRLRHGAADWKAFASKAAAIGHGQVFTSAGNTLSIQTAAASAQRGIHLEVVALLLFGILALLVTLLFVAQAVARQVVLEADDYATLRTLGVTRAQLVWIVVLRAAVLGLAGAAIALLVAALSSPLLPVGLARQAEIHPGFAFDAADPCVGGLRTCWHWSAPAALIPAGRVSRPAALSGDPRGLGVGGTWVSGALRRVAVPTTAAIGVRYGLEPGRGRSAVPVVSALVASVLGVAALAASLTVGSSLHNLISSPRQQGWNWDVLVGNPNDLHDEEVKDGALLAKDPYVASYSAIAILAGASQGTAAIDGHLVNLLLAFDPLKGYVHPPVIAGHPPRADDQIVLASDTDAAAPQADRAMGDRRRRQRQDPPARGRGDGVAIVGDLFTNGVGEGGWVYGPAVRKYVQSQAQSQPSSVPPTVFNIFAVRYRPGVSKAAAFASLQRSFGRTVLKQLPAEDVVNLQSVDRLPLLLAGLMTLLRGDDAR